MRKVLDKLSKREGDDKGQYSANQTWIIWLVLYFCVACLEDFIPVDSPVFFTIGVNGVSLGFLGISTYIIGKNVGAKDALAKMVGGESSTEKEVNMH